uniref:Protein FAM135B isoform X3 n=1 Tax=Rhizophora mucronata TaxID=61149 RepID=A0A2P2MUS2_RHIMU
MAYLDSSSVAIHEFRIPPKALLGLHSYCPLYFDAFHSVLVDMTVHISLLKASSHVKVPSNFSSPEYIAGGSIDGFNQDLNQASSPKVTLVVLVKALIAARDILLEELQKLGKAVDQAIDLIDFILKMDNMNMLDSFLQANLVTTDGEVSRQGKPQNFLEKANGIIDFRSDRLPPTFPKEAMVDICHSLGDQLSYLWNTFLQFHRANKTMILEFLRDTWARDRRAEWSIWMVYSKVDMPHHYISSGSDETSHHSVPKRVSSLLKLSEDPAQSASTRAELHRRSIAHMRINNRSIQDMCIFGDPLRIPIIIVERVMNAPRRTFSENSYFKNVDLIGSEFTGSSAKNKLSVAAPVSNGRELKIAVFVHGFQGHHLDLRLVRNQWLLIDPKIEFLMSEANEEKTSGDFREMGLRLAQEVISFLKKKMDKFSRSGALRDIKLSFVGHSIGNVIIRTALAESIMEPYLRYLYTYVSISGPHLGYLYSTNSLFNSGMWLLKKLKGTQCIHQLTFTDDPDLQNTFFYKLCEQKTLENFRHIILLSSPQVLLYQAVSRKN